MQERSPRLDAKVAIVTGAGSSGPGVGTGKAIAVLFAREGCRVLLADAVTARAEETLATICAKGGEAFVEQVDVTRSDDCRRMVDAAVDRYGRLDILVNNVGIIAPGNVVDVDEADWDRVMDTNLKSMMMTSKHAIPRMIDGGGGAIINLSSFMGLRAGYETEPVAYSASKGGVIALTTAMASEHGRDNVRVNAIAPGYLYTPMVAGNLTEELRDCGVSRRARDRRYCMGRGVGGRLSRQRRSPLGHGSYPPGRRRDFGNFAACQFPAHDLVDPRRMPGGAWSCCM